MTVATAKVVVTGATGHVGRYVVDALARAGREVVAVSRAGRLPAPPFGAETRAAKAGATGAIRPLAADIAGDDAVAALARELGPAVALVHIGGWHPPATAASTAAERLGLVQTNVLGTMRVLDAARAAGGVAAVVYTSTFEVYGVPTQPGPVDEDTPVVPVNDYGATKLAGEDHLFAFAAEEGVRAVALRLPAVYGPGEVVSRALPNFLRAVARGERPVIFGDGGDQRDQIHAADAALAVACALAAPHAAGVFNVSDGAPHAIADLARTAMRVAGMTGDPEVRPRQKPRLDFHMTIARAQRDLAYAPRIPLEAGMAEQLRWLQSSEAS